MTPDVHHRLSDQGVRKRLGEDFDAAEAEEVLGGLVRRVTAEIGPADPGDAPA